MPQWMQSLIDELGPDWMDKLPIVEELFAELDLGLCGGNLHVFQEIGAKFTTFGIAFAGATAPNATALAQYLASFDDQQASLAEAMQHYYTAMWETDPTLRAQVPRDIPDL